MIDYLLNSSYSWLLYFIMLSGDGPSIIGHPIGLATGLRPAVGWRLYPIANSCR